MVDTGRAMGKYNESILRGDWGRRTVPDEILGEVLEYDSPSSIMDIMDIFDHLDEFDLLAEVEDNEDPGRYYADEMCAIDGIPEHLRGYFDYEAYGRDIRLESIGYFTSDGYVMDNQ